MFYKIRFFSLFFSEKLNRIPRVYIAQYKQYIKYNTNFTFVLELISITVRNDDTPYGLRILYNEYIIFD